MDQGIQVDLMLRDTGSMKATVAVSIPTLLGTITIEGFKVIENDIGKPWVSLPSKDYTGKDGKRKFQKLLELPKPVMRAVSEAVLAEYERKLGKA